MTTGYRVMTGIVTGTFILIWLASIYGWGLNSDAQAMAQAQARSARGGSLHTRTFYGGGPGFGK